MGDLPGKCIGLTTGKKIPLEQDMKLSFSSPEAIFEAIAKS
jgi:hypothetical protein